MKSSSHDLDRELALYLRQLGERIRAARKAKGLTQADMQAFGFNQRHYQKLESGQANPSVATLYRLAAVFELRLPELIDPKLRITSSIILQPTGTAFESGFNSSIAEGHEQYGATGDVAMTSAPRTIPEHDRFARALPHFSLDNLSADLLSTQLALPEHWVYPQSLYPLEGGMFALRVGVDDASMTPLIPAGGLALFRTGVRGNRNGRVLLLELQTTRNPAVIIRRFRRTGAGIELHAEAAGIAPLVVREDQRDKLRVLAEFVGLG